MQSYDLFGSNVINDFRRFPKTRYQGSKRKLLGKLAEAFSIFEGGCALDLYSGSGSISLLLRYLGFKVVANDYLAFPATCARVFLNFDSEKLTRVNWREKFKWLLSEAPVQGSLRVAKTYKGIYFTDAENEQIDRFCQHVSDCDPFEADLMRYAVGQALLMKRPYNLFHRANLEMRLRDVKRSFGNKATWNTPILEHACRAVEELVRMDFRNNRNGHIVTTVNTNRLSLLPRINPNLVYLDPPYIAKNGKAIDYSDFYHFLEGLIDYDLFKEFDAEKRHRPISNLSSRWDSEEGAIQELTEISAMWPSARIYFSYRDDGAPSSDTLEEIFRATGRSVITKKLAKYKYALSHAGETHEILIVASPLSSNRKRVPCCSGGSELLD